MPNKSPVLFVITLILLMVIVFALWPSPVDPVAYTPQKMQDMTGALTPNNLLGNAQLLGRGKIDGPESVALDEHGLIYCGSSEGKIMRILTDGTVETFAETGGRPLGMKFDRHGNLIVCDAYLGLLSIDKKGKITKLATSAEGTPFKLTDGVDIARSGIIYFTDASDKFDLKDFVFDMVEMRPHGRFMSFDPATKKVRVLLRELCFANGVALSMDESFVLVNETYKYRIWRYWLAGPRAGTSDVFIDNLPGFPDNISSNGSGRFYVAFFSMRNPGIDLIHPFPIIKMLLGKIPKVLWARPERYGFVAALDEKGRITGTLQDPSGKHLYGLTSALEHKGFLYLGSLQSDRIGKYKLGE